MRFPSRLARSALPRLYLVVALCLLTQLAPARLLAQGSSSISVPIHAPAQEESLGRWNKLTAQTTMVVGIGRATIRLFEKALLEYENAKNASEDLYKTLRRGLHGTGQPQLAEVLVAKATDTDIQRTDSYSHYLAEYTLDEAYPEDGQMLLGVADALEDAETAEHQVSMYNEQAGLYADVLASAQRDGAALEDADIAAAAARDPSAGLAAVALARGSADGSALRSEITKFAAAGVPGAEARITQGFADTAPSGTACPLPPGWSAPVERTVAQVNAISEGALADVQATNITLDRSNAKMESILTALHAQLAAIVSFIGLIAQATNF